MDIAAIELNDASLEVARDAAVLLDGPGYAVAIGQDLHFGREAQPLIRLHPRQANWRYWAELSEAPLPRPVGGCTTSSDLVHLHLARLWARCEGAAGAALAVLPVWSETQLGLLLGIAGEIGMPVVGLVESAVAASRRPYPGRMLWHLEAGLSRAWVTRIAQDAGASSAGRHCIEQFGTEPLERGCAEFLARCFVECSRFDPLHDASSEQQLFNRMPDWLATASRQERVDLSLDHGGIRYEAVLASADLRRQIVRLCEPIIRLLRSLVSPREPTVLQVHARLADFPGLVEALSLLPACTVVLLEPGAAARGALRLPARSEAGGGVTLAATLPWTLPPDTAVVAPQSGASSAPTHIVYDGRAWRIGVEPLLIGTELAESDYGIRLDARSQAVSRHHCLIQTEGGQVMVHDQSRHGTWLNGHRINGSAVLQAGDLLAVGQPAFEFALIAELRRGS